MEVRKFSIPEILFGRGSLNFAALCANRMGAEKVFLVSDEGLEKAGWVERVFSILKEEHLAWHYYSAVNSKPSGLPGQRGGRALPAGGL